MSTRNGHNGGHGGHNIPKTSTANWKKQRKKQSQVAAAHAALHVLDMDMDFKACWNLLLECLLE